MQQTHEPRLRTKCNRGSNSNRNRNRSSRGGRGGRGFDKFGALRRGAEGNALGDVRYSPDFPHIFCQLRVGTRN